MMEHTKLAIYKIHLMSFYCLAYLITQQFDH